MTESHREVRPLLLLRAVDPTRHPNPAIGLVHTQAADGPWSVEHISYHVFVGLCGCACGCACVPPTPDLVDVRYNVLYNRPACIS